MGNAGSGGRGHKGEDLHPPLSPNTKDDHNQIFIFDKDKIKDGPLAYQLSTDDEEHGVLSRQDTDSSEEPATITYKRQRSNTVSEGQVLDDQLFGSQVFPTVFKWNGGGEQVLISGTFSEWKPMPMVKSHGDFVTIIDLPEGEHEFKFLVDGEWKLDPRHKTVDNELGSKNNKISVKNTDFEVFQALAMDSEAGAHPQAGDWGQAIPSAKPWQKPQGPPILPPHLLQVILNKDVPISCEPTLLPEPNHVMLNHLYALSIKDAVMVLSATHRYRRKYVTTLLYKPI